jgi:transcriptional regulator with PAS, ATPase and Fis domain
MTRFALREDKDVQGFSLEAQDVLRGYPWPGNLRELRDAVEDAVKSCPGGLALASHLPIGRIAVIGREKPSDGESGLHAMRSAYTREQIAKLLEAYGQSVEAKRRAAKELGIGLSTLYRLIAKAD